MTILGALPQARDWVVFHSEYVKNPKNSVKPREIDFLILIPEYFAVICLEAKGGFYEISHKMWYLLSRKRTSRKRIRSPIEQASSAMYALKNHYATTHFRHNSLLLLGCAVAFTDSEFPTDTTPIYPPCIIERSIAWNPYRLAKSLIDYTNKLSPGRLRLFGNDWKKRREALKAMNDLQHELNQTVTIKPRQETIFGSHLQTYREQLYRLTEDQFRSLKRIKLNDRCVIDGAAGTGKTVLAMELGKQRCEEGESVALLCSNLNLIRRFEKWSETLPVDNGGKVVAGTPATLPLEVFRDNNTLLNKHRQRLKRWPALEESLKLGYLDNDWDPFIDEIVEDLEQTGIFDYLIVDEAQNLCDEVFLKLMDALLKGSLSNGRWTMFGDFTNQDIVSSHPNGTDPLTDFGLNWSNDVLETNCRNTDEISVEVARLVDIESPPMSGVRGPEARIEYFTSLEELERLLDNLVVNFKNKYFSSRQIILLSSGHGEEFNTKRDYGGWKLLNIRKEKLPLLKSREDVLVYDDASASNTLRYSNVYDFQGLESDLVILFLPVTKDKVVLAGDITLPREEHLNRVLYTGMSRAKTMLIVVAHESYKETLKMRANLYDKLKAL